MAGRRNTWKMRANHPSVGSVEQRTGAGSQRESAADLEKLDSIERIKLSSFMLFKGSLRCDGMFVGQSHSKLCMLDLLPAIARSHATLSY
eukprot:486371-Hanusia_phi.AAC.1